MSIPEMVCIDELGVYTFKATNYCEKCKEKHVFMKSYSKIEHVKIEKLYDVVNEFKRMALNYFDMPCPK